MSGRQSADAQFDGQNGQFNTNVPAVQNVVNQPELTGVLLHMNEDALENTSMSTIDTKTRLNTLEISAILSYDMLIAMGYLPRSQSVFSRIKKRLNVSHDGKGRDEMVQVVVGKREQDAKMSSFGGGMGGMK